MKSNMGSKGFFRVYIYTFCSFSPLKVFCSELRENTNIKRSPEKFSVEN